MENAREKKEAKIGAKGSRGGSDGKRARLEESGKMRKPPIGFRRRQAGIQQKPNGDPIPSHTTTSYLGYIPASNCQCMHGFGSHHKWSNDRRVLDLDITAAFTPHSVILAYSFFFTP